MLREWPCCCAPDGGVDEVKTADFDRPAAYEPAGTGAEDGDGELRPNGLARLEPLLFASAIY